MLARRRCDNALGLTEAGTLTAQSDGLSE